MVNGEQHSPQPGMTTTTTTHVYKNSSTLNPFATEFSYKYLNNAPPNPATFYSYQNQSASLIASVDGSPTHHHHHHHHHEYNHLSTHPIPYVINQNCPPLAGATAAVSIPLASASATAEYPEYIPPQHAPHPSMVVHHSTPPIQLATVPLQSVPSYYPQSTSTTTTTNVVELFPDVYQNDETSFRETHLGKYDTSSNIKRMQNHLMSGGACFVPASIIVSDRIIVSASSPVAADTSATDAVTSDSAGEVPALSTPVVSAAGLGIGAIAHSPSIVAAVTEDNRNAAQARLAADISNCAKILNGACNNTENSGAKTRTISSGVTSSNNAADTDDDLNDHSESSDSLSSGANYNRPKPKHDANDLTKEQLDELYEEPLNTNNALKAVMGYVPKDEKRLCKHYDPKTKACFKGIHCKLEHLSPLKGKFYYYSPDIFDRRQY